MKRFQFRLERILSLKEQRERQAELQQQKARAIWEQIRVECLNLEEQLAQTATSTSQRLREAAALGTWRAYFERAAHFGELLRAAQRRLAEAEKLLQEANRLRIQAAQEVETLRALRTNEWHNYRREAARRQQDRLDELGLQRWLAAQKRE